MCCVTVLSSCGFCFVGVACWCPVVGWVGCACTLAVLSSVLCGYYGSTLGVLCQPTHCLFQPTKPHSITPNVGTTLYPIGPTGHCNLAVAPQKLNFAAPNPHSSTAFWSHPIPSGPIGHCNLAVAPQKLNSAGHQPP